MENAHPPRRRLPHVRTQAALAALFALSGACSSGTGLLRDYALALEAQRQGRPGEAESLYRQILGARPDLEGVHNNLALIARGRGDSATALAEIRAERAAHPELLSARLNEALLVLEGEGRSAARPLAENLVAHGTAGQLADPLAYLLLGLSHRAEGGDLARAEKALDEAVLHGTGTLRATAQLERAYTRAALGRHAEAAADFAEVAQQRPDSIASYDEALLRLALDDLDAAQRATDRALALDPDAVPVQLLAATLDAKMGDHEAAEARCSRVLERQPQNAEALWRRGLARLHRGATAEALVDLSAARAAGAEAPALAFDTGLAHLAAGQLEAARDAFRRAGDALPSARTNAETLDTILGEAR